MFCSIVRANRTGACIALAALLLVAWEQSARAQAPQQSPLDVQALVKETQQMSQAEGTLTIAWWVPEQYWRASASQHPGSSPEGADMIVKALRGYTLVAVIDAKVGAFGKLEHTADADLAGEVSIKDGSGNIYPPLPDDQIDGATKAVIGFLKPVMANMLGPMGQNMRFFVFPGQGKNGNAIADATQEGLFYVEVGKKEFRWRLPLGSILPRKTCPSCKESLSGAYKYCPYDGTKLPEPASLPGPPAGLN